MAINRKDFLKTMGGLAALTILPRKVLGGPGHVAPNDQLTKGIIGMGGIGYSANHFSTSEACRLVAVSDCDDNHLERAVKLTKERLGEDVKGYHLYRDLINDPNVDVVQLVCHYNEKALYTRDSRAEHCSKCDRKANWNENRNARHSGVRDKIRPSNA